jgi:predicted DCC family thiol-disulfide oxidoreductase YuxK
MKYLLNQLHAFWYSPMPPERLATLRIATGLFSLWYFATRFGMMQRIATTDPSLYKPVGIATFLPQPMDANLFFWILVTTLALNILYTLGWKFSYTGPLFAVALLFVLCYRNSWSMIYHNSNALVLHVFIIGFVPAAKAISIDALQNKSYNWRKKIAPNWMYGWPVRLICTATVGTYILSGLAKIWGDLGWSWMTGSAMRSQIAVDAMRKELLVESSPSVLFEWLYGHTELFMILGIGTMILEAGAFMALLNRRIAIVWALLTCSMHWGIYFLMGIKFPYHTTGIIFLSFFAIEHIWYQLQILFSKNEPSVAEGTEAKYVVLFDGVCNFCNTTVRFIINRDPKAYFHFISIQSKIGQQLLQQYNAPTDLSTIVLIKNGKVYTKSSAALHIAQHLSFPWSLFYVLIIVPKALRDFVYNIIAQRRYEWFGRTDEVCELPPATVRARFQE